MGNQVCRSQQPEFNDNGDACGLAHATSNTIEPQATFEGPHNPPTAANDEIMPSVSERHPPTTLTSTTAPLSPARHMFTTTTSGITGPVIDPVFVHPTPVDSPRDRAATRRFGFTTPTNMAHDSIHTVPAHTPSGDPVTVDPVRRAHQMFDWGSFGHFGHEFLCLFCTIFTSGGQGFQDATGTVAFEEGGHVTGRIE